MHKPDSVCECDICVTCVSVTPVWSDTIPRKQHQNPTEVLVVTCWHSLIYRRWAILFFYTNPILSSLT